MDNVLFIVIVTGVMFIAGLVVGGLVMAFLMDREIRW